MLQRASAAVLGALLVVHLATIIYANRGGLTIAEITGRLQSSFLWQLMYAVFIVAALVHAAIGIRNVLAETPAIPGSVSAGIIIAYTLGSATLGVLAILAIGSV